MKLLFNETLVRSFAKQAWPDPDTDLLVKAILLPPAEARHHWRRWLAINNIDDCTWPQFKLLVRLSGRLADIDPDCPEIPRLNGMAKAMWTKSQLQLNAASRCLDQLGEAGIDIYVLKAAAFEAVTPALASRRITSDLDFMVRRNQLNTAVQLLFDHGWGHGGTCEQALERCRRNPGVNLRHNDSPGQVEADVDIHHQPVHMPYVPDEILDQLWSAAMPARFRGRQVLVPQLAQLVVFTAMQGTRRFVPSHLSSGMWPIDLAELLDREKPSPSEVLEAAQMLRGNWALLSCLTYLADELGLDVPAKTVSTLIARCSNWSGAMPFYAQAPSYGSLKYINLPLRELVLIGSQRSFRRQARSQVHHAY